MRQDFAQTIVVGVGLLGGSVGLAAKKAGVGGKIVGFGRSETKLRRAVESITSKGMLSSISCCLRTADLDAKMTRGKFFTILVKGSTKSSGLS